MKTPAFRRSARERGVVLLFCLIVLVILLAGGVAIVRSMNTSLAGAGNLAFKRDLLNQGEAAVSQVMQSFMTGGALASSTATANSLPAANYSAVELKTNTRGVPLVLLNKTWVAGADIADGSFLPTGADLPGRVVSGTNSDVSIRYVIDRLCNASGTFTALGNTRCVYTPSNTQITGGSSQRAPDNLALPAPALYRLTIRVDGPRDTQVFMQTSFTKPE